MSACIVRIDENRREYDQLPESTKKELESIENQETPAKKIDDYWTEDSMIYHDRLITF